MRSPETSWGFLLIIKNLGIFAKSTTEKQPATSAWGVSWSLLSTQNPPIDTPQPDVFCFSHEHLGFCPSLLPMPSTSGRFATIAEVGRGFPCWIAKHSPKDQVDDMGAEENQQKRGRFLLEITGRIFFFFNGGGVFLTQGQIRKCFGGALNQGLCPLCLFKSRKIGGSNVACFAADRSAIESPESFYFFWAAKTTSRSVKKIMKPGASKNFQTLEQKLAS